jgi:hypothetical protein
VESIADIFGKLLEYGNATSWLALIVSIVTGMFGVLGYFLARRIQNELKSDEVMIAGALHNPSLREPRHAHCVIQTTILNKAKRKAYISKVQVFDSRENEIEITWSDRIDHLGNPQDHSQLIPVIDSASLCIRRNDGEMFRSLTRVNVTHSFSSKPLILTYNMDGGWDAWLAGDSFEVKGAQ